MSAEILKVAEFGDPIIGSGWQSRALLLWFHNHSTYMEVRNILLACINTHTASPDMLALRKQLEEIK